MSFILYYIMLISKYCSFKFIIVLLSLFSPIWCRSGEIVVGQADFSSPPDRLSCKVWETFVNSALHYLFTVGRGRRIYKLGSG